MNFCSYANLKKNIIDAGFSWEISDIKHNLDFPCHSKDKFFKQYIWVILNAGMKYQVAVQIYHRVLYSLYFNLPLETAFRNKKKNEAIRTVHKNLDLIFSHYQSSIDKISYLETLPFIGPATKYHLARNLGLDFCKPDRHLIRIATQFNLTPHSLCENISKVSGDPIGLVDVVIWRAANLGYV